MTRKGGNKKWTRLKSHWFYEKENHGNVDNNNTALFFAIELKLQQQVITPVNKTKQINLPRTIGKPFPTFKTLRPRFSTTWKGPAWCAVEESRSEPCAGID